jgi:protein RecA
MRSKEPSKPISEQVKEKMRNTTPKKQESEYDGNFKTITSTGSTLLDLSISGKRIHGGGLPGGIIVEAFGPSQSGKTVLLAEVAGYIQRAKGETLFFDPEARLDQEFTSIFGMHIPKKNYYQPDTVTEVFGKVNKWKPEPEDIIHGCFVDSSAALSTNLEMKDEEGDKMGGRRAKEFSEQLRKACRLIKQQNYLMMFSNQIRDNFSPYGAKYTTPGGHAFEFYASVRLKHNTPEKLFNKAKIAGKEIKKAIGIKVEIEVIKTVDEPYRKCDIYIIYGYGIDDIRANLQYIKDYTKNTTYTVGGENMGVGLDEAVQKVEQLWLIQDLKEEVITLWERIEKKFEVARIPKQR